MEVKEYHKLELFKVMNNLDGVKYTDIEINEITDLINNGTYTNPSQIEEHTVK